MSANGAPMKVVKARSRAIGIGHTQNFSGAAPGQRLGPVTRSI